MTKIEWTEETWNPIIGCKRISEGCNHCYAINNVHRGLAPQHKNLTVHTKGAGTDWNGQVNVAEHRMDLPLRTTKPTMWFVNSLSDPWYEGVAEATVARMFAVMALTPHHTYQVLTKRPKRMAAMLSSPSWGHRVRAAVDDLVEGHPERAAAGARWVVQWNVAAPVALPNVWLGTSVELDKYAFRADHLRATPAAVRFISAEPLLGPLPSLDLTSIDWLIVGGESGPGARPMHPQWVRDLRDRCNPTEHPCAGSCQGCGAGPDEACLPPCRCDDGDDCAASKVPAFFFKQWGEWVGFGPDEYGASITLAASTGALHKDWLDDPRRSASVRVGKAAAGRQLDGLTWDELPAQAGSAREG